MPNYYPVFMDLRGAPCLVVGGGQVAERKVTGLLACSAHVTVISPVVSSELRKLAEQKRICWLERKFRSGDCAAYNLVISAANDVTVNSQVAKECRSERIPVNIVDDPENCSFIVPAVLSRGELQLAVSSGGASPMLAGRIKEELAQIYGQEYGEYTKILAEARTRVLKEHSDSKKRREIFALLTDGRLLSLLQKRKLNEAKEWVEQCLS